MKNEVEGNGEKMRKKDKGKTEVKRENKCKEGKTVCEEKILAYHRSGKTTLQVGAGGLWLADGSRDLGL